MYKKWKFLPLLAKLKELAAHFCDLFFYEPCHNCHRTHCRGGFAKSIFFPWQRPRPGPPYLGAGLNEVHVNLMGVGLGVDLPHPPGVLRDPPPSLSHHSSHHCLLPGGGRGRRPTSKHHSFYTFRPFKMPTPPSSNFLNPDSAQKQCLTQS